MRWFWIHKPIQNQLDQSEIGIWNGGETWTSQKEVDREQERNAKKRIQDTILIPLQAVGMVIGKKGKNIKIIRKCCQMYEIFMKLTTT